MKLNELFTDDDAVSPVIGVILMVAITVILAAVIGTFVLGLGHQVQSTTPQTQFTFDEPGTAGNVDITHDGGDPVTADNVEVVDSNDLGPFCNSGSTDWGSTEITAGNSCSITGGALNNNEGTLRVTWTSDDGSQSGTLATYDYDFT
jgi:flagellin-like protein